MSHHQANDRRSGFSLIELMVVVAIIAILAGLMLPAIQKVRISARKMESSNNLKQMALAIHSFNAEKGFLPPTLGWDNAAGKAADGGANGTVFFLMLPYMEYNNYYQQFYGQLPKWCGKPSAWVTSQNYYTGTCVLNGGNFYRCLKQHQSTDFTSDLAAGDWVQDNASQLTGVAGYRANRYSLITGTNKPPKQFISPLDKSASSYYLSTPTSYLANKELLDKRIAIEKVTNGSSYTTLLTEGLQNCSGNVYDEHNYSISDSTSYYHDIDASGNPILPPSQNSNGPASIHIARTNNWAVSTEVYNLTGGAIISTVSVLNFKDPNNPVAETLDLQCSLPQVGGWGCALAGPIPTVKDAMGNIPAFFKKDPYYEPWSYFTASQRYDSYASWKKDQNGARVKDQWGNYIKLWSTPTPSFQATITPFGAPMRATFQDGRSPSVNPALATTSPPPPSNCLWFGAQAHYGNLLVAMADGSVHAVPSSVSPDSWNASISPYTTGVPVGADFFD